MAVFIMTKLSIKQKEEKKINILSAINLSENYELFEDFQYISRKQKIKIKHTTCGTIYETSIANFLHGRRCNRKECIQERRKKTNIEKYGGVSPLSDEALKEKHKASLKAFYEENLKEINDKRKNTCMERYGVDNPSKHDAFKATAKQACLKKYGVSNPMKAKIIQEKVKQTLLERYGVDNPMFSEDIQNTLIEKYGYLSPFEKEEIREKSINTKKLNNFNKYKEMWEEDEILPLFSFEEYKGVNKIEYKFKCKKCNKVFSKRIDGTFAGKATCRKCNPIKYGKTEQELKNNISLYVPIQENKIFTFNNKRYELDIFIPEYNTGIEFDGLYFHSENANGRNHKYHLNKDKFFEDNFNIKVFHVWENEWIYKKDIVLSILLNKIDKTSNRIYARKCEIKEVENKETNKFLEENHIQGSCNSKIKLGLYYENKLVSILTLSKSRYDKKYEWEIVRFCNILNTSVVGGFSKLLRYFEKKYQPTSIITYADKRYSYGELYEKNGFIFLRESKPSYFYFLKSSDILYNREHLQKHKLKDRFENFDDEITEWENMKNNGYDRIWDCGNKVFERLYKR